MKAKIHPKGQIVIPAILRQRYGIEIGESVEIIPEKECLKIKTIKKKSIMDLAGIVESKKPFPEKKEINKIVGKAAIRRDRKEE